MRDKGLIIVGLLIFLGVAAFPVWNRLFAAGGVDVPELVMPDLPPDEYRCVETKEFMTDNHMHLLDQWRNAVVRDGQTEYRSVSYPGRTYTMSLTGTCLACHTSRDDFCNRCHDYADVEPTCWDCHVGPEGT
jgi:hypothetical protein